jgi:hypothetical protein
MLVIVLVVFVIFERMHPIILTIWSAANQFELQNQCSLEDDK